MLKHKRIMSLLMLTILLISSIQNIVIAATEISKANLKADHSMPIDIEFFNR